MPLREEKKSKTSKKKNPLSQGGACLSTELITTHEEGAGVIVKALLMRFLDIVAA